MNYQGIMVRVTQHDIDAGVPGCAGACAVALAIKRLVGAAPMVDANDVYIHDRGTYKMPVRAGQFVRRFDAHKPVAPFIFKLGKRL